MRNILTILSAGRIFFTKVPKGKTTKDNVDAMAEAAELQEQVVHLWKLEEEVLTAKAKLATIREKVANPSDDTSNTGHVSNLGLASTAGMEEECAEEDKDKAEKIADKFLADNTK